MNSLRRHRVFLVEGGRRTEELIDGVWLPYQGDQAPTGPILIRDQLGDGVKGVYNPATMKRYDSRSKYQRDTKAAGGVIVGNDQPLKPRPQVRPSESIPQTISRLYQQKGWE